MPDVPPLEQRRLYARVAATFRVSYEGFDQFLTEYGDDLSRGGMFLKTCNFLPKNSIILLVLSLPGTSEEVRIIGRVAHILDETEAGQRGRRPGMGIEFLDIERDDADRLLGYLARMGAPRIGSSPPAGRARGERLPEGSHDSQAPRSSTLRKQREVDILVVDDQPAYLEELAMALGRAGFKIRKAENGIIGLAQCLKQPPDLILSDVQMPQMDGWALLRMVRARPTLATIPFVFLTALGGEGERLRGYKLGVDDYITKPYDLDALAGRLDRILARYEDPSHRSIHTKALAGDLDQVGLAALLGHLAAERRSGVLLLVRSGERATLYVADGRVVRCDLERPEIAGVEKVLYALGWPQGRFEFVAQDVPSADEIGVPTPDLLAEHARRAGALERSAWGTRKV